MVQVHHLQSKAFGGQATEGNLVTCGDAHHRLVHAGRLGVSVEDGLLVFRFADGHVQRRPLGGPDPRGSTLAPRDPSDPARRSGQASSAGPHRTRP